MQKLFTVLLLVCVVSVKAQTVTPQKPEVLVMKEVSYDFGKIQQGRPVTHLFEVTNNSTEPLRIENVQASCGCTTPEWSYDAVKPGATTTIKVGYNAAAEGPFSKSVTIIYNGGLTKSIVISGNVLKAPATSAPVNASVALLKQNSQ
jgi:hypothetical protein